MTTVKDEVKAYFRENPSDAAWITAEYLGQNDITIFTMDEWKRVLDEWWSGWEVFTVLGPYCDNVKDTDGWVVEDHSETYQPVVKGYDAPGIARLCCRIVDDDDDMITAMLDGLVAIPESLARRLERCRVKGNYLVRTDARKPSARRAVATRRSAAPKSRKPAARRSAARKPVARRTATKGARR